MESHNVPAQPITSSPRYNWFGYYDKLQFDPSDTLVLSMSVDFEGRSPRPEDTIRIGMIDLSDNNRWIPLGETCAWCWQQGCMLQWIPQSDSQIIWNDREGDQFVSHILDVKTGDRRTLSYPIYTLSPDGKTALTTDFRRINDVRHGYGYSGIPDPNKNVLAPEDSGIWHIDMESGESELILSIQDIAGIPYPNGDILRYKHYFNHILFSPTGERFVFLHRWLKQGGEFETRMITANLDGSDPCIIDNSGNTSHFIWRDANSILMFTKPEGDPWAFYLFDAKTGEYEVVIDNPNNGHCVYLPDNQWTLNDTYPLGKGSHQQLYLYHVPTQRRVDLGTFHAPKAYRGEWRCDLHARFSRDGKKIVFDSTHGGNGRQQYMMNIGDIILEQSAAADADKPRR